MDANFGCLGLGGPNFARATEKGKRSVTKGQAELSPLQPSRDWKLGYCITLPSTDLCTLREKVWGTLEGGILTLKYLRFEWNKDLENYTLIWLYKNH